MKTLQLSPANNGDLYQLNANEVVQLALEESPTTGYIWNFISESGPFTIEKDQYRQSGAIGGGTLREISLQFPTAGTWPVTFFLKREWESEAIKAERFTVRFEVHS